MAVARAGKSRVQLCRGDGWWRRAGRNRPPLDGIQSVSRAVSDRRDTRRGRTYRRLQLSMGVVDGIRRGARAGGRETSMNAKTSLGNIGPRGRRARFILGLIALALGVALVVSMEMRASSRLWRL